MPADDMSSETINFRSIEEDELKIIHRYQNGECKDDLASFEFGGERLDYWTPIAYDVIKEKNSAEINNNTSKKIT